MRCSFWLKGHQKLHLIYLVNDILDHCIMKNAAALQVLYWSDVEVATDDD